MEENPLSKLGVHKEIKISGTDVRIMHPTPREAQMLDLEHEKLLKNLADDLGKLVADEGYLENRFLVDYAWFAIGLLAYTKVGDKWLQMTESHMRISRMKIDNNDFALLSQSIAEVIDVLRNERGTEAVVSDVPKKRASSRQKK